ncbi:MAG: NAD-dependent epimerase/dehydratase family protein [bacterium]
MERRDSRPCRAQEIVARVVADALMVNGALFLSLLLHYVWSGPGDNAFDPTAFATYVRGYLGFFGILTLISLSVLAGSGFYSRGRTYRERYKAMRIFQAVSLSHLMFGILLFFLGDVVSFPRVALLLSWSLTLLFLLAARLGPVTWQLLVSLEERLFPNQSPNGRVRRVLVIGGAGYIGSALVRRLLDLGYQVRVLDMLVYGDESISEYYDHPKFELIEGDFRNIQTIVGAVKGMDAIVHLGAIVGDSACSIDPDLTIEINLRATRTIAEVGKGFGVKRFIFASTCSVYGASEETLDERSTLCPLSLYARTKMESERILLSLTDSSFAPTILRFGTVYGLSGRPRFDLVVNLLAAKAIQDGEAGIFGGDQWRPLVHVRDVAEAIVKSLEAPFANVRGEVFNVGSNEQNSQISELGLIIKEMVPEAQITTQPDEDNRSYRVRFDKIQNELGFCPRYTIRDGIQEILDAFESGEITDYRDARYNNYRFLNSNGKSRPPVLDGAGDWNWVKLSGLEAMMLSQVVMAVFESQSPELIERLPSSLVQAMLGDADGFLDTLMGRESMSVSKEAYLN